LRWALLATNLPERVKSSRAAPRPEAVGALSPKEARRFQEAVREYDYHPLFVLALTTGMRLGELFGLRWEDIDLEAGVVYVRRGLYRIRGEWVEGEPKSAAGKRKITLPALAVAVFKEHRLGQLEARLRAGLGR
jgi:integrase